MTRIGKHHSKFVALAVTTALAGATLGSATAYAAPSAETSAERAQKALSKGKHDRAIGHAEAAVQADPQNAAYRAMLGATYMQSGRFQSAATSFDDAMTLGDSSARTVLSYSLAQIANGENAVALAALSEARGQLTAADLGLALALAGQADQGVGMLENALRAGPSSAKLRQNLAYAYALQGNWRSARVMAAEDVPANQLDERISDWARSGRPEDYQLRVANLLQVTAVSDAGRPAALALVAAPSVPQMAAAEELAPVPVSVPVPAPVVAAAPASEATGFVAPASAAPAAKSGYTFATNLELPPLEELPPLGAAPAPATVPAPAPVAVEAVPAPAPAAPASFAQAFEAPAPTPVVTAVAAAPSTGAIRFVSNPVVQAVPAAPARVAAAPRASSTRSATPRRVGGQVAASAADSRASVRPAAAAAPARASAQPVRAAAQDAPVTNGSHLVQLGSFSSKSSAERAWGIYTSRYPQLAQYQMVITEAQVRGKKYFRVSAGGFARADARNMCSTVKGRGQGCIAWAEGRPLPGAIDTGVRMARR